MTGCHNCQHAAAIAAGEYAERDWERVPCSTCDVMSGADSPIAFDENRKDEAQEAANVFAGPEAPQDDLLPITVLKDFVLCLLKLRPELRDVVAWRYMGVTYDEIAMMQGISLQAVEKRQRRAMKLWPALQEFFPRKVARQKKSGVSRGNHNQQKARRMD